VPERPREEFFEESENFRINKIIAAGASSSERLIAEISF
jgi:hypothetical protein